MAAFWQSSINDTKLLFHLVILVSFLPGDQHGCTGMTRTNVIWFMVYAYAVRISEVVDISRIDYTAGTHEASMTAWWHP